jgi:hypothetical protein
MDKIDFSIESKKEIEVIFNDKKVMVLPFIPQNIKLQLAKQYVEFMFGNKDATEGYYQAEWAVIIGILTDCTNITVTEDNIDGIVSSGLWDAIKAKIENYQEFRNDLRLVSKNVADQIALEKSLGNVIGNLSGKVSVFLDNISKIDFSKEGMAELSKQLVPIVGEIEKITGATQGIKKPRKPKESKEVE